MELLNSFDEETQNSYGIITKEAIAKIKGMENLDIENLRFHDAEITKLTVNYQGDDFIIDVEMNLEWGKYSHISWHFDGIITYKISDDGGDRYLWDAGFFKSDYNDFLIADFGAFGRIKCLRAEISYVEEFDDGISPAQAIVDEHIESGKEGIPCVSTRRTQSY